MINVLDKFLSIAELFYEMRFRHTVSRGMSGGVSAMKRLALPAEVWQLGEASPGFA